MKRYHNPIKIALMMGIAAFTLTSCQDWLTIYPQDKIVEDNFWEDKNDLEGVRYAAYQQMCNTVSSMALWGDLRSDSYSQYNGDQATSVYNLYFEIRDARIERDSANTYFDWEGFYKTINYCNKVLQHGAEVLESDKQFTNAEWQQMKAEITGLRALNYFYLIRAFKDVPYSTKVINNDSEVLRFGATNQLVVLDSLIIDVEEVAGKARNRFSSKADTKGLITNPALYAMLSDMYLWRASLRHGRSNSLDQTDTVYITNRPTKDSSYVAHTVRGDYQKAIEYADLALSTLALQNDRSNAGFGEALSETTNYGLENCYLYKNKFENFANGMPPTLTAFAQIFGGNSEESIFELQFSQSEGRTHSLNGTGSGSGGIWGYATRTHLGASDGSLARIYSSSSGDRDRDSRMWFSAWNQAVGSSQALPGHFCFKWSNGRFAMTMPESHQCKDIKIDFEASNQCNWIIYRISDVMLQKAEALAILGQGTEAMKYVNAIHRRWYCNDSRSNTSQPSEDVTNNAGSAFANSSDNNTLGNAPNPGISDKNKNYETAVLNERQLEFMGEGKRWFDLVRYAERHAGGPDGTIDPRAADAKDPTTGITRADRFPASCNELPGTNNGLTGVKTMVNDLMTGEYANEKRKTLINRMKNRYGLYNLIYYKDVKASNGNLEQNPVWNKSLYD